LTDIPLLRSVNRVITHEVHKIQENLDLIVRECTETMSKREVMINLEMVRNPANFPAKFKSSLSSYLLDHLEENEPHEFLHRLYHDLENWTARLNLYESQVEGTNTLTHTARSLLTRLINLVHGWTVFVTIFTVFEYLPSEENRHLVSKWDKSLKDVIVSRLSEKLRYLTSGPRWVGMDGPFDMGNLPDQIAGGYEFKASIESSVKSAFRGSCEYISYILVTSTRPYFDLSRVKRPYTDNEIQVRNIRLRRVDIPRENIDDYSEYPRVFVSKILKEGKVVIVEEFEKDYYSDLEEGDEESCEDTDEYYTFEEEFSGGEQDGATDSINEVPL